MRLPSIGSLAAPLVVAAAGCALNRAPLRVTPGERLRVTAPDAGLDRVPGMLARLTADTLVFQPQPDRRLALVPVPISVARRAVVRLERSDGRHGHFQAGTTLGMLAGGVAAAVVGYVTFHEDNADTLLYKLCGTVFFPFPCPPRISRGGAALADGVYGAALGGVIGGVVGLFVRTERWIPLPIDRLGVTVGPLSGGRTGLGVSFALRPRGAAAPSRRGR